MKYWNIEQVTGYKPITTYYEDFGIAEDCYEDVDDKIKAINDTYNRATSADGYAVSDYEVLTEFVMVLNHKIWEWYEKNDKIARNYDKLWRKAQNLFFDKYDKDNEALKYYYTTTD